MRVVLTGGGTAGHVYPNLSVAAALRALRPETEFLYIGTGEAREARIVRGAGFRYTGVRSAGLRARSVWRMARGGAAISRGVIQAVRILARFQPNAVFATGGYASVPPSIAAAIRRTPLIVFLPDVYPGWAVRLIAKLAGSVATTTEAALEFLPVAKTVVTGYPVRPEFFTTDRHQGRERMGLPPREPVILVTGASSGAVSLNTAFARHLPQFAALAQIVHSAGPRDEQRMLALRERLPVHLRGRYHVSAYIDDMAAAMASSDVAISRAGASILGEFPAVGLPAVLVPLDLSDQDRNARFLVNEGAAVIVNGEEAPARLYASIDMILKDPVRLTAMRRAMTALARPHAARDLARLVIEAGR